MINVKRGSVCSDPINPQEDLDFEKVLATVGTWGRYQKALLAFMIPLCMFTAYVVYAPVFFLFIPDHWCNPHPSFLEANLTLEEIINLTIPLTEDGTRSSCKMYNVTYEEVTFLLLVYKED